ncbi:MAG: adenosine deaminase [Anaerolineaceae bacterium]|nr:adenosine deaminase [Anaerolineaceae bacterium]
MGWYKDAVSPEKKALYACMPKVELHRHLEGSLRVNTLMEIARDYGITLPLNANLDALVQIQPEETLNFNTFLSKFQTLRLFYRSPEIIRRVVSEAVEDAAADGVLYMELRFTPVALARLQGFQLSEVMDWVCEAAGDAASKTGTLTRLIASVNRHESPELAATVVDLALARRDKGIVGLDLAGNEADFSADPFIDVFKHAQANGLPLTVHAGEWNGASNVRQAIEVLGAARVAHGVRVMEDPAVVDLARERATVFEVCVTSNVQSGVVTDLAQHPLPRMLKAGLDVTINTDDPGISQITLSDEYALAVEEFGFSLDVLAGCVVSAARAAFLPADARDMLVSSVQQKMAACLQKI